MKNGTIFGIMLFLWFFLSAIIWVSAASNIGWTLTKKEYQSIISGEVILGAKNATITIIEYSDLECPFCIRHHKETFPRIQKNFAKTINFIWKNNRWVNHPGTEAKAIAILCVKEHAPSKYYSAIHEILSKNESLYDVKQLSSNLGKLVSTKKLAEFQSCVRGKRTKATFEKETQEAQAYQLDGTPGFLIINNTTREYTTILWAYPYDTFREAIKKLSKK
jgi:protein-disulfide isomerase